MGQNKRSREDAVKPRYKAKRGGRFISAEEARKTLEAEQAATCANNENGVSVVIVQVERRGRGGGRREETALDERSQMKIRRLEADLAAERERTLNLKAKVDEKARGHRSHTRRWTTYRSQAGARHADKY